MSDLDELDAAYEQAEAAYLNALRGAAERPVLAALAADVARAAEAWNVEAYRAFHAAVEQPRENLDRLTERTEVLSELWADTAAAYGE